MVQLLVIAYSYFDNNFIYFYSFRRYMKTNRLYEISISFLSDIILIFQEVQSIEGKTKFNVNTKWTDISFLTFQPKANEPQDDIIKIDSLQNCVCSFKGKTYIAITQLILHICLRGAL